ncbi:MAG: DUF1015 domain-containing protein [Endomicrobiales bacterium]|nr:DUF1015 domain-containing protein [Endomicrobiales bacterium]
MSKIKPFSGVRYNEKNISRLICPPYDVISSQEKSDLKKQSFYNMVKLELPDDYSGRNKYQQSGFLFRDWVKKNVLKKDIKPAFYFYEQEFMSSGKKKRRRGFFAALKLENPRKGQVKPHEKTLAKPKEDRLNLIKEVKANLSPIFGLFNDSNKKIVNLCNRVSKLSPDSYATDKHGVKHRLWLVDDKESVNMLAKSLLKQNVFIADGHHRYETAWNFMQGKSKLNGHLKDAEYVMIFLCPMEDPGLVVWPTHRVVKPPEDMEERINKYFNVLPASKFSKLSSKSPQPILLYYKGKKRTLVVKNRGILAKAMADKCRAYQDLGVSILHSLLLKDVLPENITYVKSEQEAYKLAKNRNHLAAIVPSTPVEAVKKIALAKQTMPQKSTYFYPKVATGMVVHAF